MQTIYGLTKTDKTFYDSENRFSVLCLNSPSFILEVAIRAEKCDVKLKLFTPIRDIAQKNNFYFKT